MHKALIKDTFKEIKKSYKRFISILLMAMLGVGFFVGIKAASPNMRYRLDKYFDEKNVFDIQVSSTLGLTDEDIESIKNLGGVKDVYGSYNKDIILEKDDTEYILNAMEYSSVVNQPNLLKGNLPEAENECVVEEKLINNVKVNIGDTIKVREEIGEDEEEGYKNKELKITGIIESPLYVSIERGNSNLGSGKVDYYIYVSKNNINSEIYTSIYVTSENAKELESNSKQYKNVIENVKSELNNISEQREQARYDYLVNEATTKINDAEAELNSEKTKAEEEIAKAENDIKTAENKIVKGEKELKSNTAKADKEFSDAENLLKTQEKEYEAQKELMTAEMAEAMRVQLENARSELEKQKTSAYAEINSAKKEISSAKIKLADGKKELEESKKEFEEKVKEAEEKLSDAKKKVEDIKRPEWYVLDREEANAGYRFLMQDADSIENISKVFPALFFVVAALMSLTTMTRMIDEQRTAIGTLKALGYNKFQISSKYTIYAILATILGSILGTVLGYKVIPPIILNAYFILYSFPDAPIVYDFDLIALGLLVAIGCIVGGAFYASHRKLKYVPAQLMRPKAPKARKKGFT